jgi:hypothetical protein
MNTLLSLACFLVAVTMHVTYVYLRRRNSFLRKLQGPESTSFLLGEYLDLSHPRLSTYAEPQGMKVTSVIKMKLETMNSSGCGNTVLHGVEVGHSG